MDQSATAYAAARFVQGEMTDIKDFLFGTLQPQTYMPTYYDAADHLKKSIDILKIHYPNQHNTDYDVRTNALYTITLQDMLKIATWNDGFAETIFDFLSPESKTDDPLFRKARSKVNIIVSRAAYRAQLKVNRSYENGRN
ncbi:MAG TPA: hypothetical protein VGF14_01820, partial [Alphaproteobacteria bacterium]